MNPKHFRQKRISEVAIPNANIDIPKPENQKMLDKLMFIQSLLRQRDTSRDANPEVLLDQVLQEVQEIKSDPRITLNSSDCKIEGQWVSESAGGLFTLPSNATVGGQEVLLERQRAHDHVHNGFMNFKDWNNTLTFPHENNSQYIIINGLNNRDKIIATFMGECRVCRKKEVLQGNWLIVSHSRDCESLGTTAKLISDVFRRDNIQKLRTKHLNELNAKKNSKSAKPEGSTAEPTFISEVNPTTKKVKGAKPTMLHIKLH